MATMKTGTIYNVHGGSYDEWEVIGTRFASLGLEIIDHITLVHECKQNLK